MKGYQISDWEISSATDLRLTVWYGECFAANKSKWDISNIQAIRSGYLKVEHFQMLSNKYGGPLIKSLRSGIHLSP